MNRYDVAVVGAGAWGCALALQALRAGNRVVLWARDPTPLRATRRSPHLSGVALPEAIALTGGSERPEADLVLLAVPVQHLRGVAGQWAGSLVVCCKGIETGSHALPLEILATKHSGVLTGPNFAGEIAAGLPAAAVAAAADLGLRELIAQRLGSEKFRIYSSADPVGAQIGGAAKNVIAIAAGAVMGAGLGENARAALVTRGLAELARLAAALGGRPETTMGLSGLGDLLLTCTGSTSRNYSLGHALGRGEPLAAILAARTNVTEGVATAPALVARARAAGQELPICAAVAALVEGQTTVAAAIATLLARPRKDE